MKLRPKLIAIFTLSYSLILVVLIFTTNTFLMQGFLELEKADIQQQTDIGLSVLDIRLVELDAIAQGFAAWDDACSFIQEKNIEYIESINLDSTFMESDINLILLFNDESELVYSKAFDLVREEEVPVPNFVYDQICENGYLLNHQNVSSNVHGIMRTTEGPVIVATRPIITSAKEGPIRGTLLCARYLDSREIGKLREYTSLSLGIYEIEPTVDDAAYQIVLSEISDDNPIAIHKLSQNLIAGVTLINDIFQEPAFIFMVEAPRVIYQYGLASTAYFIGGFMIVGVIIGLLTMLVMDSYVISRLTKLSHDVSELDPDSFDSSTVTVSGDDEISTLSNNIKTMLDALKEYQFRLKENERMAAIGEMSAMVGHDLRNPIQVIYGLCSVLKRKITAFRTMGMDQSELDELEMVDKKLQNQVTYMNKIISDLQDYSKTIKLVSTETDLRSVVDDVLSSVKTPSNIDVSVSFEEDFPVLKIDANLMRRVFTNLITNAVQAMFEGGHLTVRGHVTDMYAFVDIEDTGEGISEENMEKIFRPLFTTKAKGTGLGLSVCERIVESHDGDILVESEVGVGSTFTMRLPLGNDMDGVELQTMPMKVNEIAEARQPS